MPFPYDALLLVSFGGPEGPDDVLPFLQNVTRGRNTPPERLAEVAEHYQRFGGVSPINAQNRALIAALKDDLLRHGLQLPIYFGNRNWHPLLPDTLGQMAADGIRRALAFFTSPYSSYSSCRQYLDNIAEAQATVGPSAPQINRLRAYFNHPGFIEPMIERVRAALDSIPADRRGQAPILFTAHSIPLAMAATCQYETQLREASRLVSEALSYPAWELVYQSRSGPPSQLWLEPDGVAALRRLHAERQIRDVVLAPIGFISDHIEVVYDLDVEARAAAEELEINLVRAQTVGTHPRFVTMIRELIEERLSDNPVRLALGMMGASHDVCAPDCCAYTPMGRPKAR